MQVGIARRLVIILTLVLFMVLASAKPVLAISVNDYFSYTYNVKFSKAEVYAGEAFYVTVETKATCIKDLPVPVSEASITGRIVAEHQASGTKVTLNSSYTVTMASCPNKAGDSVEVSQIVPLQFPLNSQIGIYSIVGELIAAKVKILGIWFDITSYLPSSQIAGSVTCVPGSTGVGGGGGGGGGIPTPPEASLPLGTTDLSSFIGANGIFTKTVVAVSANDTCKLSISEGTRGLTLEGTALARLVIVEAKDPPTPPKNSKVIGTAYELTPSGATFEPSVNLTIAYDPNSVPQGVNENKLFIAMWDAKDGDWFKLVSTVDAKAHTISTSVNHFTLFSILASIRPSAFTVSDLSITPVKVVINETVTISVLVTNIGDISGSQKIALTIDNTVAANKEITLGGGESQGVAFTIAKDIARTYIVTVDSLSGRFTVEAPAPPPEPAAFHMRDLTITPARVNIGEEVTISILMSNSGNLTGSYQVTLKIDNITAATEDVTLAGGASRRVIFTIVKNVAGTYSATVDGLSGTFVVNAPALPSPPINWPLIGGIGAAAIIAGVFTWFLVRRQRT